MRRSIAFLLLVCMLSLGACAGGEADPLAVCRGALQAQLEGELNGVAFTATLTLAPRNAEGVREATLTFYAPEALCGTCVQRDAAGALVLLCGDLSVPTQGAQGLAPLLDLFPDDKTVTEIAPEGGLTRITGDGFALLLHPDGTPAVCRTPTADVRVVEFAGG